MAQASLGLIETIGLVAAVEAADVAVKSASVSLVGYELAEGGLAVVKIQGDVGAVRAAAAAAAAAAARVGRVVAWHVIARPADGLSGLISNARTVGRPIRPEPQEPTEPVVPSVVEPAPVAAVPIEAVCEDEAVAVVPTPTPEPQAVTEPSVAAEAAEPESSVPGLLEPEPSEPAAVADEVAATVEPASAGAATAALPVSSSGRGRRRHRPFSRH